MIFPEHQSAISKWPPPLIVRPVIRSCDAESGSGRVAKRRSVLRPSLRPSVLGFDLVSRLQEADRPRILSSDDPPKEEEE